MTDEQFRVLIDDIGGLAVAYGMSVLGAILILIVGLWLSGRIQKIVRRGLERTGRVDETLTAFLSAMAKYLVLVVTVLAVLSQFGIEIASLLVVFGSIGLAIGLALQGTLSNLAAGVMMLLFRYFKVGDFITVGGHSGTIKEINLFVTEMATVDNVQIIIPNGQVWGQAIVNYSVYTTRRCDFVFGISYGDSIDTAMAVIRDAFAADARAFKDPEPVIVVNALGDSSVDIAARVWCASDDYWQMRWDLTKQIKEEFDANGITIPFPSRTMYQVKDAAE